MDSTWMRAADWGLHDLLGKRRDVRSRTGLGTLQTHNIALVLWEIATDLEFDRLSGTHALSIGVREQRCHEEGPTCWGGGSPNSSCQRMSNTCRSASSRELKVTAALISGRSGSDSDHRARHH